MLNLFRRRDEGSGSPPEGPPGSALPSHILAKFLKRLRAMSKPHLLDLGRVSGANIEFFAQAGCRVRVEDLLNPEDEPAESAGGGPQESAFSAPPEPVQDTDPRQTDRALPPPAPEVEAGNQAAQVTHAGVVTSPLLRKSGSRPSRRIVLPPRTFSRTGQHAGQSGLPQRSNGPRPGTPEPPDGGSRMATSFPFPDESFDAIVAWDIFNYYGPEAARLVAAEVRRILRPGGLVLSYFHARRLEAPEPPGRYRILDEGRVARDPLAGRLLRRYVYQNRDIEKMFTGLRIVELYFLKSGIREVLMEKKVAGAGPSPKPKPLPPPARPRFTID